MLTSSCKAKGRALQNKIAEDLREAFRLSVSDDELERFEEHLNSRDGVKRYCPRCVTTKPVSSFGVRISGKQRGNPKAYCRFCEAEVARENRYKHHKNRPMSESKESSAYLGVYIAERVLSSVFKDVTRMPYGHPGYDFICNKGYKIDVKCSCIQEHNRWAFNIKKTPVADYYLCLAFDDRTSLEPKHIWLIPCLDLANKTKISISMLPEKLHLWSKYERPLDKVVSCCDSIRAENVDAD
jgi:hypothetical protein